MALGDEDKSCVRQATLVRSTSSRQTPVQLVNTFEPNARDKFRTNVHTVAFHCIWLGQTDFVVNGTIV